MKKNITKNKNAGRLDRGVTLYIAIVVTSAILLVSFAITNVTLKQSGISSINQDSHAAFYAADSGAECALYWDMAGTTGTAFSTTSQSVIFCNVDANNPLNNNIAVGGVATSTFMLTFHPQPYCAHVFVAKYFEDGQARTAIESKGYNTCEEGNIRRVERAVRITY